MFWWSFGDGRGEDLRVAWDEDFMVITNARAVFGIEL